MLLIHFFFFLFRAEETCLCCNLLILSQGSGVKAGTILLNIMKSLNIYPFWIFTHFQFHAIFEITMMLLTTILTLSLDSYLIFTEALCKDAHILSLFTYWIDLGFRQSLKLLSLRFRSGFLHFRTRISFLLGLPLVSFLNSDICIFFPPL